MVKEDTRMDAHICSKTAKAHNTSSSLILLFHDEAIAITIILISWGVFSHVFSHSKALADASSVLKTVQINISVQKLYFWNPNREDVWKCLNPEASAEIYLLPSWMQSFFCTFFFLCHVTLRKKLLHTKSKQVLKKETF